MLGIEDGYVLAAYLLCLASAAVCVIYGLINWNRGAEARADQEEVRWAAEEDKVEQEL